MSTPEGRVKKKVDTMLRELGVWYFNPQAGTFGRAGIPDKIACVSGRFIGIEVKADATKKPTRLQEQAMKNIEEAGGKCFVVYDAATINEVKRYILRNKAIAGC